MQRGEIRVVNLDPVLGAEAARAPTGCDRQQRRRQHHRGAPGARGVTIVPVTSNTERVYPFQVLLAANETGLGRDSKAQAEQSGPFPANGSVGWSASPRSVSWIGSTKQSGSTCRSEFDPLGCGIVSR